MSAVFSLLTSIVETGSSIVLKTFGRLATVVGRWIAILGQKILSFEWIKSIYEAICKVAGYLKKTIFNAKVVKIMNILLSLTLFALAVVQAVFGVQVYIADAKIALSGVSAVVFFVINAASFFIYILYLLAFVLGIFKKRFRYGFISALFITYLLAYMSYNMTGLLLYRNLADSFGTLKIALIVIFAVLAVLKLFDQDHVTSVFAFLLCGLGVLFVYLLFRYVYFANVAVYEFGKESSTTAGNVGFLAYFRHTAAYFAGTLDTTVYSPSTEILLQCVALSEQSGKFVASLAVVLNGLVVTVSEIAPYLLLSVLGGFAMGMINNRFQQVAYLSKTSKALKYLFFGILCAFLAALILSFFFGGETFVLKTDKSLLSLFAVVGLAALCALSRKLIIDKYANKLKLKKKIK